MSLLREIQSDAVDAKVDISVVLRKCKVLAARLSNEEFKLWVEHELNGYPPGMDLPKYRVLYVESRGDFYGMFQSTLLNAAISSNNIPGDWRDFINHENLTQPISYYASLIVDDKGGKQPLRSPWPADLIVFVQSKIIRSANLIDAWKVIPYGSIVALLDTVRNRILSFVLEIESEAPDAGEALPNTKPIPDEKINQVFNTIIQGNVTNLAAGSQTITQTTQITVIQNDLESLRQFLKSIGITEPDLKELDEAVHEDAKSKEESNLGHRVKGWLVRMIAKSGSSVWNITTSVATSLLTKALSKYYGLEI